MSKTCERCGSQPEQNPVDGSPQLFDFCAECSKDLCAKCMAKGCCGHVPAKSGNDDFNDEA